MAVTVYYEELLALNNLVIKNQNEWSEILNNISASVEKFHTTDAISGEGAESMKNYMYEVHTEMTKQLQLYLAEMVMKITSYVGAYLVFDGDPYAILDSATLAKCYYDFTGFMDDLDEEIAQKDVILGNISDMYTGFFLTTSIVDEYMEPIATDALWKSQAIEEYEPTEYSGNASGLASYGESLENLLGAIEEGNTVSFENYKPGTITSLDLYQAVYAQQAEAQEYCMNATNVDNFVQACNILDAANAYVAEVDARGVDSVIHFIEGTVMVVGGVALIVGTWGMATPVVVGSCVVGGTSMAFGAAEYTEGSYELYYYTQADRTSVAFNPIRDTYFNGNQETYDNVKDAVSTITDLYSGGVGAYKECIEAGTRYVLNEAGEWVLKEATEDIESYVAISVLKDATVGFVQDQAVEATSNYVTQQVVNYHNNNSGGDKMNALDEYIINNTVSDTLDYGIDKGSDLISGLLKTAVN